jgi:hypothetical protein
MVGSEKNYFYYKPWTLERMRGVVVYTLGRSSVKPMKHFLWKDIIYQLRVCFFHQEIVFLPLLVCFLNCGFVF